MNKTYIVVAKHRNKIELLSTTTEEHIELSLDEHIFKIDVAVGDFIQLLEDGSYALQERKNTLSRKRYDPSRRSQVGEEQTFAANIDYICILAAVQDPPFHPKFIDRFLTICEHTGIPAHIVLTKTDLEHTMPEAVTLYKELGYKVSTLSNETEDGITAFKEAIRNKTVILVGQSGVGKSTLFNNLTGRTRRTGDIQEKGRRGKHTTTSSLLYKWDIDSYVIDTPGIRHLGLWGITKQNLQFYYKDIAKFRTECKYPACSHTVEDGCHVLLALDAGKILEERYDSYATLYYELQE